MEIRQQGVYMSNDTSCLLAERTIFMAVGVRLLVIRHYQVRANVHQAGNALAAFAHRHALEQLADLVKDDNGAALYIVAQRKRTHGGYRHQEAFVKGLTVLDALQRLAQHIPAHHKVGDAVERQLHRHGQRGQKLEHDHQRHGDQNALVKCIMHEIPFDGELKIGHNVEIGYFAQNQAMLLDENLTVHDTIDYAATGEIRTRINDILGAFMFGGAASEKKVKVLSGGERSRLAMIQLLLQPVNLLILDEPTNHLDIRTKDILKEAIKEFDGTVIVVSHDRDFLDGLVDKVYEFGNGLVKEHLCGIYEFLEYKKLSSLQELEKKDAPQKDSAAKTEEVSQSKLSYLEQKEAQKRIRHAEKRIKELETKINTYESEIKEIENLLSSGTNTDQSIYTKHQELNEALENAMMEWETANEEFETLQNND